MSYDAGSRPIGVPQQTAPASSAGNYLKQIASGDKNMPPELKKFVEGLNKRPGSTGSNKYA